MCVRLREFKMIYVQFIWKCVGSYHCLTQYNMCGWSPLYLNLYKGGGCYESKPKWSQSGFQYLGELRDNSWRCFLEKGVYLHTQRVGASLLEHQHQDKVTPTHPEQSKLISKDNILITTGSLSVQNGKWKRRILTSQRSNWDPNAVQVK